VFFCTNIQRSGPCNNKMTIPRQDVLKPTRTVANPGNAVDAAVVAKIRADPACSKQYDEMRDKLDQKYVEWAAKINDEHDEDQVLKSLNDLCGKFEKMHMQLAHTLSVHVDAKQAANEQQRRVKPRISGPQVPVAPHRSQSVQRSLASEKKKRGHHGDSPRNKWAFWRTGSTRTSWILSPTSPRRRSFFAKLA